MSINLQKILPSKSTPEVILDPEGTIKLTGWLRPEDAEDFFHPIVEWINEYLVDPAEITYIEISLEYINSAGTRYLLDIIRKILHVDPGKNFKFIINWYFNDEDEDILEKGRLFSSDLGLPFNFIRIT